MASTFLDGIIDQIREETGKTGAIVTNLKGVIADAPTVANANFTHEWYVLRVPGTTLPTLRDFLDRHTHDRYPIAEVNGSDGVTTYPSGTTLLPGFVYGLVAQLDLSGPDSFTLSLSLPGAQAHVYVDGGFYGQIDSSGEIPISLSVGSYTLSVLISGGVSPIVLSLPSRLRVSRTEISPDPPIWERNPVAQYLEPANGSYQVLLAWRNAAAAAEWQVYRADAIPITAPTGVALPSLEVATLTFTSELADVQVGSELCTDIFRAGHVLRKEETRNGSNVVTQTLLYVRLEAEAPTDTGGWAGRTYYTSSSRFISIARLTYSGSPSIEYIDINVRGGFVYFYKVTALSYLRVNAESDFSEIASVVVRDTVAPGNVSFNSSTGVIREPSQLILMFTAPSDADYRATHVYHDVSGTLTLLAVESGIPGQPDSVSFTPPSAGLYRLRTVDWAGNIQGASGGVTYTFDGNFLAQNEGTTASLNFTNAGELVINIIGPSTATVLRAAVSTSAFPDAATVDASSLTASASMASLQTSTTYSVGTRVYVSARAYISGVGQRLIQVSAVRDAGSGSVALGPNLEIRVSHTTTVTTITYVATGTVTISENGGSFSAAPSSPFTRNRPAAGSADGTVTLKAVQASQEITGVVTVPAQSVTDTDTVTPDLVVTPNFSLLGNSTNALHQQYTVTATNPKSGGPAPTITVVFDSGLVTTQTWNGSTWNTVANNSTIASGTVVRVLRPPFQREIQTITFVASLGAGQGSERISRTIANQDAPVSPVLRITLVGSTNTTQTFRIATEAGGAQVRWNGGTASQVSGLGQLGSGTYGSEPQDYTFNRPANGDGDVSALFEAAANGRTDADFQTIRPINRDTLASSCRVQILPGSETATALTARVSGAAKLYGAPYYDAQVLLSDSAGLTIFSNDAGQNIPDGWSEYIALRDSPDDPFPTGSYFNDYVITKPAVGALPRRVIFTIVPAPSTISRDSDAIDVQPQLASAAGRIEIVSQSGSNENWTIVFKGYTNTGAPMASGANGVYTTRTPENGTPTNVQESPTYNSGTNEFTVVIARPVKNTVTATIGFTANSGTAFTELTISLPIWDPKPRLNAVINVQPTTFTAIQFTFSPANLPGSGVEYTAICTTETNGTGYRYALSAGTHAFNPSTNGRGTPGGGFNTARRANLVMEAFDTSTQTLLVRESVQTIYYVAP
jgi:hypothetical protein